MNIVFWLIIFGVIGFCAYTAHEIIVGTLDFDPEYIDDQKTYK